MKFPFLIAITASLGGCGFVNAVMPLPDSEVAACLSQGMYLDRNTRQCAAMPMPVDPPLSPEQQAKQQEFNARIRARAAQCTTGTQQLCLAQAQIEESRIRAFCETEYGPAASNIWGYRAIGWPAEMTADHVHMAPDLAIPLIKAGYSGNWKSAAEFNQEAQRRCLDGHPF
jgi:hypothetical protein